MPPEQQIVEANINDPKTGGDIVRKVAMFFSVLYVLVNIFVVGLFTLMGLAWGNFAGVVGVSFSLFMLGVLWKIHSILKKHNTRELLIIVYLLVVAVTLLLLGLIIIGIDTFLFFTAPPLVVAILTYIIWRTYDFTLQGNKKLLTRLAMILFSSLGIPVIVVATAVTFSTMMDKMEGKKSVALFEKRIETIKKETRVFDLSDSIILSSRGNPIGIKLEYSITGNGGNFSRYTDLQNEAAPSVTPYNLMSNHGMFAFSIDINPEMSNNYMEKDKVYNIIVYALPNLLATEDGELKLNKDGYPISRVQQRELDAIKKAEQVAMLKEKNMIELKDLCQFVNYPKSTVDDYPMEFYFSPLGENILEMKTVNKYNIHDFYRTLASENVTYCQR